MDITQWLWSEAIIIRQCNVSVQLQQKIWQFFGRHSFDWDFQSFYITKWWNVDCNVFYRKRPAPAYERYEYLAKEGPPSLALPGKYQRLLTMFQGTDTVVSMLYNRQEIITFSKLQAAVQSMTRKWVLPHNVHQGYLALINMEETIGYLARKGSGLAEWLWQKWVPHSTKCIQGTRHV